MAGGTGNPDIATAIAAMGDTWWTDVICPWTDGANLTAIEAEAATRNGPLVMQDFAIFAGVRGTYSGLTTFAVVAQLGAHLRHRRRRAAGDAGRVGRLLRRRRRVLLATSTRRGRCKPWSCRGSSRRRSPTASPGRNATFCFGAGIGTFRVDDGGLVRIERAVSTYVTNAYGVADPSWRDLETKKTVAWIRYQRRARVATKFPRHKLASDGTRAGAGQALVTPKIIRADGIAQFRQWEEVGIVESVDSWIGNYIVERDATDPNRVNELLPADIVNQLRVFAGRVQFVL